MVNPLVGSALVTAGAGLVDSAISAFSSGDKVDYGKQLENWMIQQAYNTPANQVARLRAAGLNPNLIYGNGSAATGNASSGPYHEVGILKSHSNAFAKALDLQNIVLQVQNLKAQNKAMNMQADNLQSQAEYREAQTKYTNAILDFYDKHGYFPGQANVPTNLASEFVSHPTTQRALEPVADALGSVAGYLTSDKVPYEEYGTNRAQKLAEIAADKKGLRGYERADYVRSFVLTYNRYH